MYRVLLTNYGYSTSRSHATYTRIPDYVAVPEEAAPRATWLRSVTQLLTPAQHTVPDPLVGHPAPDFSLAMLRPGSGKSSLSLSNFKGKPVVLNFWASWCAPCKEEMPLLERTWKQVQGKDVVFLGIDFQDSNSAGINFLQANSITYPLVLDADGSVAFKYGITSLPQTIFINRHGTVVSRVPRELTSQALSSGLQLIM